MYATTQEFRLCGFAGEFCSLYKTVELPLLANAYHFARPFVHVVNFVVTFGANKQNHG